MDAASSQTEEILSLLVSHGAEVDAQDLQGRTPLMEASVHGCLDAVVSLVRLGANPDLKNQEGKSAQVLAEEAGQWEVTAYLREQTLNKRP